MCERQLALAMMAGIHSLAAHAELEHWLTRAEQGDCPPELLLEVLEAAAASAEPAAVARRQAIVDKLAANDIPAEIHAASIVGGDAARGEQIFLSNEALSCRRCHSLKRGEQLVGPSLAAVGAERTRAEIVESITRPNAKIVDGFQTTAMMLDTGVVVTGILRKEDDKHAVLMNADGKEVEVDLATVEDRVQGLSAMPEDLMKHITPRDLRDLVEFLSTQRKTGKGKKAAPIGH
jgi:quinoprotein glucose dehydrogenase